MKNILIFIFILIAGNSYGGLSIYQKLSEVNKCWMEQKDVLVQELDNYNKLSEKEWIQLHLALVEQTLRSRQTNHLNTAQHTKRFRCLDILHRYWQDANFPINEDYAYRTPIFIDKYNNFCAVGFLIKETGHEGISRRISAQTNHAYVREMNYPELGKWAEENGFTIDELAWIQPAYPPQSRCQKVGNGVDGFVQEFYVDTASQQLYVGGKFVQADKSFVANNIAYVTENAGAYTWHKMADGVNGAVNAITKFDGKIFVAGSFNRAGGVAADNIAYWDGSTWYSAGCIDGEVRDLLVFEGVLYAAGEFKSCAAESGRNFAKWNGSIWTMIAGIEGKINTMEVYKGSIVLGGRFDFDTIANLNAIKWNSISSFQRFDNKVLNEVMDFEVYTDTLHVACKKSIVNDSVQLLQKLYHNHWIGLFEPGTYFYMFGPKTDSLSLNTLCAETKAINLGGYFSASSGMTWGSNTISFGSYWVNVDSTVNKMILFKNELILGGKFKTGMEYKKASFDTVELNGITKRLPWKLSIPEYKNQEVVITVYPNPVSSGKIITTENGFLASDYIISTVDGKQCASGKLSNRNEIQLPQLASGTYFINLRNTEGQSAKCRISIE
ncbi:MAG: T9SS type A sorting domain-containing protein [Bacteroidota bacterium]